MDARLVTGRQEHNQVASKLINAISDTQYRLLLVTRALKGFELNGADLVDEATVTGLRLTIDAIADHLETAAVDANLALMEKPVAA